MHGNVTTFLGARPSIQYIMYMEGVNPSSLEEKGVGESILIWVFDSLSTRVMTSCPLVVPTHMGGEANHGGLVQHQSQ